MLVLSRLLKLKPDDLVDLTVLRVKTTYLIAPTNTGSHVLLGSVQGNGRHDK